MSTTEAAHAALTRAAEPDVIAEERPGGPEDGIGLCLSGGGYRAMLFHLGALWRLNQLGFLPRLDRVSSVSGGSITAGVLAHRWDRLAFENGVATRFEPELVDPLRAVARRTIDVWAILLGLLHPPWIGSRLVAAYRRHLFGDATLHDLPARPRFVFNATNVQSGSLFRLSQAYARDYRVGGIESPTLPLAVAVAASSAFPPFLSPVIVKLRAEDFTLPGESRHVEEDLERPPFRTRIVLTDGGVYDNLGLETVWKRYRTVLISDGGGHMKAQGKPHLSWAFHAYRVLGLIDNQVRSLRKRQAVGSYVAGVRSGAYWGVRTDIADYPLDRTLDAPWSKTLALADVATRLGKMDERTQERLINWGYAVCDAAIRAHVQTDAPFPDGFPYPDAGVG